MIKNKKAALELSIGTVVVIVLAMGFLIMGLILLRSIFEGAKYNVDTLNDKVRGEINKLFTEDSPPVVVYLPNSEAKVGQGKSWGVSFGIKNIETGTTTASQFIYQVDLGESEGDLKGDCGISKQIASSYIKAAGRTGNFAISPGQVQHGLVRVEIPKTSPLCTIRYNIEVKKDNKPYQTTFFDVTIR